MKIKTLLLCLCFSLSRYIFAAPIELNVIHTGDLHSYFEPKKALLKLGGIARLKTLADRLRQEHSNNLFVDGGDWSEGNIMYTVNEGTNSYRIIDQMKYDAVALGNHDWLLGAAQVAQSLQKSNFSTPILASNLSFDQTPQNHPAQALQEYISPYIVKQMNGIKVGIFGLSTYQLIYDSYLKPVEIKEPTLQAFKMVQYLRNYQKVDMVIVLSHLGLNQDKLLASYVKGINLIVGAHDHLTLKEVEWVKYKFPKTHWLTPIVQVGPHGRYVGQTILQYDPESKKSTVSQYQLISVNRSIPENPTIKKLVDEAKQAVVTQFGPVFDDQVVINEIPLLKPKVGPSNLADLVSDAIWDHTQSDLSFFVNSTLGGELPKGQINSFDIFNALPFVIDFKTGKTWQIYSATLKTIDFKLLLNLILTSDKFFLQAPSISGARIEYDGRKSFAKVRQIILQRSGLELKNDDKITISSNRTLIDALEFIRSKVPMQVENVQEFPIEGWQLLRKYLQKNAETQIGKTGQKTSYFRKQVSILGKLVPYQADLLIPAHEIKQESTFSQKQLVFTLPVFNIGKTAIPAGAKLTLKVNPLPNNEVLPQEKFISVLENISLPEIPAETGVSVRVKFLREYAQAMLQWATPEVESYDNNTASITVPSWDNVSGTFRQYEATITQVKVPGGEISVANNSQSFFLRD